MGIFLHFKRLLLSQYYFSVIVVFNFATILNTANLEKDSC